MVLVGPVHEDDGQIVVVEFSAEPGRIVPALAGQGPVPEVPELDAPVHLVLTSRREQDVLPVQPVAMGVLVYRPSTQPPGGAQVRASMASGNTAATSWT